MRSNRGLTLDGAFARLAELRPTRRQVKIFILVFLGIMILGSYATMAAHAAEPLPCVDAGNCEPTPVAGAGDLIPMPDLSAGGSLTLFESFEPTAWFVDSELTMPGDAVSIAMNGLTNLLLYLWVGVVYMTIGIAWWLFGSLEVPGLSDATTQLIGSAAGVTMQWLFPTAVALGAVIAYMMGKQAPGSQTGQIVWMVAAGVLAVGLATQPAVFTQGTENIRTAGSDMVLSASADAITANETEPFAWPSVDYSVNTNEDAMLRKSADSMWRALVVTPWCLAEFGSLDACDKYGLAMLEAGADTEERKVVIKDMIYPTEGNGDTEKGKKSETGAWVKGDNWGPRLGIVVLALIVAIIFCFLLLLIGFWAMSGVIMTYMLLIAGVFFAALWIIPGLPRRWGVAWGETLVGTIMITFAALLTFGIVLALLTGLYAASAGAGWAISMGLAIVLVFTAFGFRKELARILGAGSTGAGRAALVGAFVTRGAGRAMGAAPGRIKHSVSNTATNVKRAAITTRNGARAVGQGARQVAYDARGGASFARTQAGYVGAATRTKLSDVRGRSYLRGVPAVSPRSMRPGGLRPGPQLISKPARGLRPGPGRPGPTSTPRAPRPTTNTKPAAPRRRAGGGTSK